MNELLKFLFGTGVFVSSSDLVDTMSKFRLLWMVMIFVFNGKNLICMNLLSYELVEFWIKFNAKEAGHSKNGVKFFVGVDYKTPSFARFIGVPYK
ncbi:hypothetical protein BpHYR1_028176 [Brachionus plicatilis]|uniref:Uncharacterized protein n=1 Tax=Brachionus plicatilis TaxID=10195 RepID=A0A3M7QH32_BRAPC|nr:hypothetical protein BpHYR1_028176 [Brachionus plicatilis]